MNEEWEEAADIALAQALAAHVALLNRERSVNLTSRHITNGLILEWLQKQQSPFFEGEDWADGIMGL